MPAVLTVKSPDRSLPALSLPLQSEALLPPALPVPSARYTPLSSIPEAASHVFFPTVESTWHLFASGFLSLRKPEYKISLSAAKKHFPVLYSYLNPHNLSSHSETEEIHTKTPCHHQYSRQIMI